MSNVRRLVDSLHAEDATFVIHVDKKCEEDISILSTVSNVYLIKERVSITWGNITVVDAVLKLAEYALSIVPYARYYCLLSGADFPVKNHEYIKNYLNKGNKKDYIQGIAFPSSETQWIEGGRRRLEAYVIHLNSHSNATIEPRRFTYGNIKQFCKVLFVNYKCIPKAIHIWKTYPQRRFLKDVKPYAGEMWWMLTNETLSEALCWNRNHPEYYQYHLDSQVPDEMYMNSIVWNISDSINKDIKRYISWEKKTDMSPRWMVLDKDLQTVKMCIDNPDILFIRKVKEDKLLIYISEQIHRFS